MMSGGRLVLPADRPPMSIETRQHEHVGARMMTSNRASIRYRSDSHDENVSRGPSSGTTMTAVLPDHLPRAGRRPAHDLQATHGWLG